MNYSIEVKNLTKIYNNRIAVDKISFQVEKSTIHGFIGPNGAGKTTTLNALMGLIIPTSGELFIEGKKVINDPYFNQNIGYVESEPIFKSKVKVESYIYLCGSLRNLSHQQIEDKLRKSSLNNHRHKLCHELSTGWKKILLIFAATSLYEPKVLILDEVRNGLDFDAWSQTKDYLNAFKEKGGSVLFSTHILDDIQKLADNVTFIDQGKIIFSGEKPANIEDLYKNKKSFINSSEEVADEKIF